MALEVLHDGVLASSAAPQADQQGFWKLGSSSPSRTDAQMGLPPALLENNQGNEKVRRGADQCPALG